MYVDISSTHYIISSPAGSGAIPNPAGEFYSSGFYCFTKSEAKPNISGSNFVHPSAHISPNGGSS